MDGGFGASLPSAAASSASSASKGQSYSAGIRDHHRRSQVLALLPKVANAKWPGEEFRSKNLQTSTEGGAVRFPANERDPQFNFDVFLQGHTFMDQALGSAQSQQIPRIESHGSVAQLRWTKDFENASTMASTSPAQPIRQYTTPRSDFAEKHYLQTGLYDGDEVVRLLSNPAFNMNSTTMDLDEEDHLEESSWQTSTVDEQGFTKDFKAQGTEPPQNDLASIRNPFATFSDSKEVEGFLSEWKHVLNRYTDEVWGDLLPVVEAARAEFSELESFQQNAGQLKSSALRRLEMLWGHIAQNSIQKVPHQVQPLQYNSTSNTKYNQDLQYEHDTKSYNSSSRKPESQTEEEEAHTSPFHCPWIGCHYRFQNSSGLLIHTDTHSNVSLECAHVDCGAVFAQRGEWAEHLQQAHHDLVGLHC